MNIKNTVFALSITGLAACGFGGTSNPARFYAITTPTVASVRGPEKSVNIVIENVSVPQSVDRPQIVVKEPNSNMVTVSEFDRWIEGLNTALPVAISENMNMYTKNINARPGRNAATANNAKYIVSVDFVRFETELGGDIAISAWWTVSNDRGDILVQKKTNLSAPTPNAEDEIDYDAIVAEQSKLIARLAYKIADVISGLK